MMSMTVDVHDSRSFILRRSDRNITSVQVRICFLSSVPG